MKNTISDKFNLHLLYEADVSVIVTPSSEIIGTFHLSDVADQVFIIGVVTNGLAFRFPDLIGPNYVAEFTKTVGLCVEGSVSQTGHKPNCRTCPSNTFSNRARTICQACPKGTH